ncbi:MAG: hypothetical protein AAGH79_00160 [Bacteroidota bacterium]
MHVRFPHLSWIILSILAFSSCTEEELITVTDNQPPTVNNVPAIKIENYVNRIFIDLLGREPLDLELAEEAAALRDADLSIEARRALVTKLQTSNTFIEGDSSYRKAHYQHLYNLGKVRCLEGASDQDIREEQQNADGIDSIRLERVLTAGRDLQAKSITIEQFFGRMIFNKVYDVINMNSFNFVNATFDNLLWRFPTQSEFQAGFNMVEFNQEGSLLGRSGSDKEMYVDIIISSPEMYEGLIIWAYQSLLARRPTTEETVQLLDTFYQNNDFEAIQQAIMVTDEYAGF